MKLPVTALSVMVCVAWPGGDTRGGVRMGSPPSLVGADLSSECGLGLGTDGGERDPGR